MSRHRGVGRVLIVRVKIFNFQCCIFSQKCCGVPWFVHLPKSCLCKWEVISLISHAFQPTVNDDELSIREDEDMTFNIPWTRCFPVNSELNFFFIHQFQSTSMKILVSHTPEIDKKSESVSSVEVCWIYRAVFLTKSSEDLLIVTLRIVRSALRVFDVFFISKFRLVFSPDFHFKIRYFTLIILLEHSSGDDDNDEVRPQVVTPVVCCRPVSRCVSWSSVSMLHKFRFHYPCWWYQGEVSCE